MPYVRIVSGKVMPFSVSPKTLYHEVMPVCWPWPVPDRLLAEYGIFPVVNAPTPSHSAEQRVVKGALVRAGDTFEQQWIVEDRPRAEHRQITLRQFRLACIELGLEDAILAKVTSLPVAQRRRLRVEIEQGDALRKGSPLVQWLQSVGGMAYTDAQIDNIWTTAATQ